MQRLLNKQTAIVALLGVISLFFFGYHVTRDNEIFLFVIYALLTGLFLYVYPFWKSDAKSKLAFRQIIFVAVLFRLVLLFSTPNLSDDYHRFIWDGELISSGYNPYEFKPVEQKFNNPKDAITLKDQALNKMNSKEYYSVYPPGSQVIFGVVSYASGNNSYQFVILLRLLLIGFDIGVILILAKLLKWFSKRKS